MRGKDEWGTLQLMSNTRDLRERRVREGGEEGERGGEEIRGYRLISIGDKRLRRIFSQKKKKKRTHSSNIFNSSVWWGILGTSGLCEKGAWHCTRQ